MEGPEVPDFLQVPQVQKSNPNAQIPPFPTLVGEHPILVSKTTDGNAMVTNFRFCVCERRMFINIPLMAIGELVVVEAAKWLKIGCKDASTYSCTFATVEDCQSCTTLLREKTGQPRNLKDLFAYRFCHQARHKKSQGANFTPSEAMQIALSEPGSLTFQQIFDKEVQRLGFDTNRRKIWRMSHANEKFEFCPTYPKFHILPATVDDEKIKFSLDFRALKRFPSVVWRDKSSGVILIRSSQPLSSFLGVSYFTNHADVYLIEEMVKACNADMEAIAIGKQSQAGRALLASDNASQRNQLQRGNSNISTGNEDGAQGSLETEDTTGTSGHGASNGQLQHDSFTPRKLAIVDCRSLAGVWGNSFKGGGTEDEVMYKCNIVHLDLANIHTVRDSFNKMRSLCHNYTEGTYYKSLASCMWLTYISALLKGANLVVDLMHNKKRPVLVHCSDGWDRTSQICSMSELMMDPYYRTLEGFQVLVERGWLHFGHKFGERGGHDPNCSDTNQISPIFLQFLDCVYQLTLQYPAEFQFNETYLVKLVKHSQACLFGTFLHNCEREREDCPYPSASVWTLLKPDNQQFINLLYKPAHKVLIAKHSEHDVVLWKSVYMAGLESASGNQPDFALDNTAAEGMPRSKSMDDLSRANADSGRRNSDPSTTQSQESAAAAPIPGNIHDTSSSSAELLHYPEDLAPAKMANVAKLEETAKESPPKSNVSPKSGSTTPVGENVSSQETSPANSVVQTASVETAAENTTVAISEPSESLSVNIPNASGEQTLVEVKQNNAQDVCVEDNNIQEDDNVFSENSVAQALGPSSSAVFCQTEAVARVSEKTLCCDQDGESNGLSSELNQSPNEQTKVKNGSPEGHVENGGSKENGSCPNNSCTSGTDETEDALPQKDSSKCEANGSSHQTKQTSLLSERLAQTGANEVNGNAVTDQHEDSDRTLHTNGTDAHTSSADMHTNGAEVHTNGSDMHINGADSHTNGSENQHSKKSQDITELKALLKNNSPNKDSRPKSPTDSGHSASQIHSNGKSGRPISAAVSKDSIHHYTGTSPSKSTNTQTPASMEASRTNINSASTDTITDENESGGGDSTSPSAPRYSKPLEINTKTEARRMATSPLSSASALMTSPTKNGHQDNGGEAKAGSKAVSRRARAASGASRDLSASPSTCTCRGNWSDTGRLRNPSGGEMMCRGYIRATVATSTTDISDSYVGQVTSPTYDRQPSIKQHIDIDGLTLFGDERQDLLTDLMSEKDRKIQELESKLSHTREMIKTVRAMKGQQQPPSSVLDEFLNSDSEGGELNSLGALSNPASDASWENIEETEAKMVLWVPDSAVTHCAACDGLFWLGRRKHHCRNCGKVFCAECSNYMAPVPHQHLNKPERVCSRCHSLLLQLSPGASSDGRILTLVADG